MLVAAEKTYLRLRRRSLLAGSLRKRM